MAIFRHLSTFDSLKKQRPFSTIYRLLSAFSKNDGHFLLDFGIFRFLSKIFFDDRRSRFWSIVVVEKILFILPLLIFGIFSTGIIPSSNSLSNIWI